jgi:hypothetical protein
MARLTGFRNHLKIYTGEKDVRREHPPTTLDIIFSQASKTLLLHYKIYISTFARLHLHCSREM